MFCFDHILTHFSEDSGTGVGAPEEVKLCEKST
jgi:hypothetical protein